MKGKLALVTGSTSGIGLGTARALAQRGANIVLNGFGNADEIEQMRAALEKDFGVRATYQGADLADPAQIGQMMSQVDELGGADILVNNAGIQFVAPH